MAKRDNLTTGPRETAPTGEAMALGQKQETLPDNDQTIS